MGLTLSNIVNYGSVGTSYRIQATATFDNSYPKGGEALTASSLGLVYLENFEVLDTNLGYSFDTTLGATPLTSLNILVYQGAGGTTGATSGGTPSGSVGTSSITESPAVVADAGILAFVPVNVTSVYATVPGIHLNVVPSTVTPATGEISINFATGAFTTFPGDAVTAITIVYQNSGGSFGGNLLATHTHSTAGGPATEVANGTDLSALVIQIQVYGK